MLDPDGLPLSLLREADGSPVVIKIGIPGGRTLHAHVWKADVGRVPLLMLDSDVEENDRAEREVTDRLYGGGGEHRLQQELLLGVGGVRALRAYARITGLPSPRCSTPTRATPASSASSASASSCSSRASRSTRRCRPRAPARSSPRTPRCPRASTASRARSSAVLRRRQRRSRRSPSTGARARRRGLRGRRPDQVQHGGHGPAPRPARQRRLGAARRGEPWHVLRPLAGLRRGRGADRLDHQRRPRLDVGGARGARPARGDRRPRGRRGDPRLGGRRADPARRPLGDQARAALTPRRRRPCPSARLVGAARRVRRRARLDRRRARPRRAHDRLRPPCAVVQAAHAHAARPRAAEARCCCTPSDPCSWSSPASRTPPTTAASG